MGEKISRTSSLILKFYTIHRIIVAFAALLVATTSSTEINCLYRLKFYKELYIIYHCEAENVIALEPNSVITNVTGQHFSQPIYDGYSMFKGFVIYKDSEVKGIYIEFSVIYFFPKNIEQKFTNLTAISILNSKLREIHQVDLKVFPDLRHLSLRGNEIQVIEKDLFEFNTNLEVVSFNHNHIKHIDPNVFDALTNIKVLQLALNPCLSHSLNIERNPKYIILEAQHKCKSRDDESSDWMKQEEGIDESIEVSCENCRELTITACLFIVAFIVILSFVIIEKFYNRAMRYNREIFVMN